MNKWYNKINKSQYTPPSWVFGYAWSFLYATMAISLFLVWTNKKCYPYCDAVTFFFIQLALNLIWTTLFFKYKLTLLALLDLACIIFFTCVTYKRFYKVNKYAGYLLIPYICWLCFAFYLNLYIVVNN